MAIRLLTGLPVPRSLKATSARLVGSLIWFPVVGAALGALLGLAEWAARAATRSDSLSCAMVVALGLLVTGGRPVRGLMVLTGALFAGRDHETLALLASRSYPTRFGVLVGIAGLLLRYALVLALPGASRFGALLLAGGLGRAAIVWVCWRFPYADIDTGVGGWLAAVAGARDLLLALPVVALSLGLLAPGWVGAAVAGAWLVTHGFALRVARALSGVTAHTFEATAELGELSALGATTAVAYLSLTHY